MFCGESIGDNGEVVKEMSTFPRVLADNHVLLDKVQNSMGRDTHTKLHLCVEKE